MNYEDYIKKISHEPRATRMGKHRRYTLDRFQSEFANKFGNTLDVKMNRMYDVLFDMRKQLIKKGIIPEDEPTEECDGKVE